MSEPPDIPAAEPPSGFQEPGSLPPRPRAGRSAYAQRVAERTARRAAAQATATRVCAQLSEPNIAAVTRLVELFGVEFIETQAAQAVALRAAAAAGAALPPVLQTRNGQLRTAGGVFFQLLQEHATQLGLHWPALALPPPPSLQKAERGTQNQGKSVPRATAAVRPPLPPTAPVRVAAPPAATASPIGPAPARPGSAVPPLTVRPARARLTVVGSLAGPPRAVPGPAGPLVELPFRCEMTPTLPKGLPVLGPTPVLVWCTPKQWNKVRDGLSDDTRLIAEGEAALTTDADGGPLLQLVCLNLRTLEQEQIGHGTAAQP